MNAIPDHSLRFVTTRDEESMARSSDDVFLAEEESESFKQQVEVSFAYLLPSTQVICPPDSYMRDLVIKLFQFVEIGYQRSCTYF